MEVYPPAGSGEGTRSPDQGSCSFLGQKSKVKINHYTAPQKGQARTRGSRACAVELHSTRMLRTV